MSLRHKIKDAFFYRNDSLRARFQRFLRGYSYGDVWDIDSWFMRTIKPMLIHLRDHGHSVPFEFENNTNGWRDVLNEMIECLELMDEDEVHKHLGFNSFHDLQYMTIEDYKRVDEVLERNKNRFFELFSKYFYSLWD